MALINRYSLKEWESPDKHGFVKIFEMERSERDIAALANLPNRLHETVTDHLIDDWMCEAIFANPPFLRVWAKNDEDALMLKLMIL